MNLLYNINKLSCYLLIISNYIPRNVILCFIDWGLVIFQIFPLSFFNNLIIVRIIYLMFLFFIFFQIYFIHSKSKYLNTDLYQSYYCNISKWTLKRIWCEEKIIITFYYFKYLLFNYKLFRNHSIHLRAHILLWFNNIFKI